jgi:hypothetical protein
VFLRVRFARAGGDRLGRVAQSLICVYPFLPTTSRSHRGHHDAGIACKKRPTANPARPLPKANHTVIAHSRLMTLVAGA